MKYINTFKGFIFIKKRVDEEMEIKEFSTDKGGLREILDFIESEKNLISFSMDNGFGEMVPHYSNYFQLKELKQIRDGDQILYSVYLVFKSNSEEGKKAFKGLTAILQKVYK